MVIRRGWPYSGHRAMRNSTLASWEAEECPQPGFHPGAGDEIALLESGTCLPRYHMASPVNTTSGAVTEMALYAGTGSARINRLVSAKEVVEELSTKLPLNYTRKQGVTPRLAAGEARSEATAISSESAGQE